VSVFYNDIDHHAAQWLRNLRDAGFLPKGVVREQDIGDIQPDDLVGFRQAHFFAGIGGWPYALQLAEWPTTWPVWTGSCPCQPFSAAGLGAGTSDARHLWPEWRRLIDKCRPAVLFGEQVCSRLGREWLSAVRTDLEAMEYAVGAADLCAAGRGARRTSDNACSSWPSPIANDATGSGYAYSRGDHSKKVLKLPGVVRLAQWPTPTVSDAEAGPRVPNAKRGPTPKSGDSEKGFRTMQGAENEAKRRGWNNELTVTVMAAGWVTPTARDWRDGRSSQESKEGRPLNEQAVGLVLGPTSYGFHAETGSSGQLNSVFSLWLMGYPDEWLSCAPESRPSPRFRKRTGTIDGERSKE